MGRGGPILMTLDQLYATRAALETLKEHIKTNAATEYTNYKWCEEIDDVQETITVFILDIERQ